MRVNFIPTIIAIAISLLIAYGLYAFYDGENKFLLFGGSFFLLAATLFAAIGTDMHQPRTSFNIKVVSGVFFAIALGGNVLFSLFHFSIPAYILTNGILFLIFILIVYSIYRAQQ
jgi:hypothetical protein